MRFRDGDHRESRQVSVWFAPPQASCASLHPLYLRGYKSSGQSTICSRGSLCCVVAGHAAVFTGSGEDMERQMFVKLLIALTVVWSSFAGVAAQDAKPADMSSSPLFFGNIDKNHDGAISRSEVPKDLHDLRVHFSRYDANQDQRLSSAEYSYYLKGMASGNSGACNTNQQILTDPNCAGMGRMRENGQRYSPPPPPIRTGGN